MPLQCLLKPYKTTTFCTLFTGTKVKLLHHNKLINIMPVVSISVGQKLPVV